MYMRDMAKQLIFVPDDEELEFIYEHIDSWSKWCHTNLKRCINGKRYGVEMLSRVSTFLLILSVGIIVNFLGLVVITSQGITLGMFLLGSVLVIYSVFSIIGVYRYG